MAVELLNPNRYCNMPKKYILEIASFTLEGALDAEKAGAHRIELCDNASEGGTTPSYGMLVKAKQKIKIPIFPIIRPRGGDFVYSKTDFESMKEDILICKKIGYQGIVVGILNEKGHVHTQRLKAMVKLAHPMQVTFHRAFDRTKKPLIALEEIIDSGCHRILTSGQYPSITEGKENVRIVMARAKERIIIMPGSGLKSSNVKDIALYTGAIEFHTAARKTIHEKNIFSPKTMNEKMGYTSVDKKEIKNILKELDALK